MKAIFGGLCVGVAVVAGGCAAKPGRPDPGGRVVGAPAPADRRATAPQDANATGATGGGAAGSGNLSNAPAVVSARQDRSDAVLATVGTGQMTRSITLGQMLPTLMEAHGLNILLNVVQLELAKQGAEDAHVTVTPADLRTERELTLAKLFRDVDDRIQEKVDDANQHKKPDEVELLNKEREDEHRQMLEQFFTQQRITAPEFDLMLKTNAYLRKIAEPKLEGKITEDILRKEFAARFGESLRVRHIALPNPQDVLAAKRRLAAGEPFGKVAREMSTFKPSAVLDGELPPFSRTDTRIPKNFKEVAFALKVGEVSDVVEADNAFHLIKLEERIMPKAVKFEDQRDILFHDLHEEYVASVVKQLRENIAERARLTLKITDPLLAPQFADRIKVRDEQVKAIDRGKLAQAQELDRIRQELMHPETRPETQPRSATAAAPATTPAAAPATRSLHGPPSSPPPLPATRAAPATTHPAGPATRLSAPATPAAPAALAPLR